MANENKTVIVDFDGTICGFAFPECGPPEPHVREGLQKLRDAGLRIEINSVSTNINWGPDNVIKHVCRIMDYMREHDLPYDCLNLQDKPMAAAYIDDRGVAYRGNWLEAADEAIKLAQKDCLVANE